jgi:hypothetical protein
VVRGRVRDTTIPRLTVGRDGSTSGKTSTFSWYGGLARLGLVEPDVDDEGRMGVRDGVGVEGGATLLGAVAVDCREPAATCGPVLAGRALEQAAAHPLPTSSASASREIRRECITKR